MSLLCYFLFNSRYAKNRSNSRMITYVTTIFFKFSLRFIRSKMVDDLTYYLRVILKGTFYFMGWRRLPATVWAFENSDNGNLIVTDTDVGLATTPNTRLYKCDDPGATTFLLVFIPYSCLDCFSRFKPWGGWPTQKGGDGQCSQEGRQKVWSLTQSYSVSVGFSKSPICEEKCAFNKHTIKVCVSCSWPCSGTFAPSAPHLTVSLYLCSSETMSRLRALEGRRVSSKRLSRVQDQN